MDKCKVTITQMAPYNFNEYQGKCVGSFQSHSIYGESKGVLSRWRRREGMQLPYGYLEGEILANTKNRPHVHLQRCQITS